MSVITIKWTSHILTAFHIYVHEKGKADFHFDYPRVPQKTVCFFPPHAIHRALWKWPTHLFFFFFYFMIRHHARFCKFVGASSCNANDNANNNIVIHEWIPCLRPHNFPLYTQNIKVTAVIYGPLPIIPLRAFLDRLWQKAFVILQGRCA